MRYIITLLFITNMRTFLYRTTKNLGIVEI